MKTANDIADILEDVLSDYGPQPLTHAQAYDALCRLSGGFAYNGFLFSDDAYTRLHRAIAKTLNGDKKPSIGSDQSRYAMAVLKMTDGNDLYDYIKNTAFDRHASMEVVENCHDSARQAFIDRRDPRLKRLADKIQRRLRLLSREQA